MSSALDEIGSEALADPARVEADADRDADGAGGLVDLDAVRAGAQRGHRRLRPRRTTVEALDVAGAQDRAEQRRVEATRGDGVARRARDARAGASPPRRGRGAPRRGSGD